MNNDAITRAAFRAAEVTNLVRLAHGDAVNAENQLAEMVLLDLLAQASEFERKVARVAEALK